MKYFLQSRKEIRLWSIALIATIITGILNFQPGPSHGAIILARPILISLIIIGVGFLLRFNLVEIAEVLKKYGILLFLSLFISIPHFIWYFLGQEQYGVMILILGIINIDIVTVLQTATVFSCMLLLKKLPIV